MNYDKRDVIVTGMGMRTPLGYNVAEVWDAVNLGRTSIRSIGDYYPEIASVEGLESPIGSLFLGYNNGGGGPENFNFDYQSLGFREKVLGRRGPTTLTETHQLALTTANEAIKMSGLEGKMDPYGSGVVAGVGMVDIKKIIDEWEIYNGRHESESKIDDPYLLKVLPDSVVGVLARQWDLRAGSSPVLSTSCASGASAILYAAEKIRSGDADVMLVSSTTQVGDKLSYKGFRNLRCLSGNPNPEKACRPFDVGRDGLVMGEGSAAMILESYEHARNRNAPFFGRLSGYAEYTDTSKNMLNPDTEMQVKTMERALNRAGLSRYDITHLNAHATSTPVGDRSEALAIEVVFRGTTNTLPVSATKGATGHMFGTTALAENIFTLLSINDGLVPPTRNFEKLDDGLEIGVHSIPIPGKIRNAMSNSFGFFGHNISTIWSK